MEPHEAGEAIVMNPGAPESERATLITLSKGYTCRVGTGEDRFGRRSTQLRTLAEKGLPKDKPAEDVQYRVTVEKSRLRVYDGKTCAEWDSCGAGPKWNATNLSLGAAIEDANRFISEYQAKVWSEEKAILHVNVYHTVSVPVGRSEELEELLHNEEMESRKRIRDKAMATRERNKKRVKK